MDSPDLSRTAEENLRVIRQLMERSTVYRIISAVPAILTGLLAIAVAGFLVANPESVGTRSFVLIWLGVYVVVDLFNFAMLYREARQRQASFPSPQMLHAVIALVPPLLVLGVLGFASGWIHGELIRGVFMWVMGYGLGLVAMMSFAPRSLLNLGWAFLFSGLFGFVIYEWRGLDLSPEQMVRKAALIMGITFGGWHLIYGLVMLAVARRPKA